MGYLFDQLLPCSWRGIVFATTGFMHEITHDLAQHKRPDRDGARVESTGRNPQVFSAKCLFRNNVTPSRAEAEGFGVPFPDQYQKFLAAMGDRSTGTLQHPVFGLILCKPVSAMSVLDAGVRDGADVDAQWIEDSESEDSSNLILSSQSAISEATINALELDASLVRYPIIRDPGDPLSPGASLEDAMFAIKGTFDQASLLTKRIGGKIDAVIYRVESIQDSIASARDPQLWPARQACVRMKDALVRLAGQLLVGASDVKFYIVPGDCTMASLASKLRSTMTELISLNPGLTDNATIPRGTAVRYYYKAVF